MKFSKLGYGFLLMISWCFFSACSAPSNGDENNLETRNLSSNSGTVLNASIKGRPKYFGFWGNAVDGVGHGNYISETSPYSNIAFIEGRWTQKLAEARKANQKAILMVQNILYPHLSSLPHPDFKERFLKFWKSLEGYHDVVIGFYIFDEPFTMNSHPENRTPTADVNVLTNLDSISYFLRQTTSRLTALTHAYTELRAGKPIVRSADWIGFNCYLSFGDDCSDDAIRNDFQLILSKKAPGQKLMITMDGVWINEIPNSAQNSALIDRIHLWTSLIASTDQVAAVTPFLYQSTNNPSEFLLGARDNPPVLQQLKVMAGQILSNPLPDIPFQAAKAGNELWSAMGAIDRQMGSAYSSLKAPNADNSNGSVWFAAWIHRSQVTNVVLTARMISGRPQGFPKIYDIYITNPEGNQWIPVGRFDNQPNFRGEVIISLGTTRTTTGIMIIPIVLGTDDFGGHYLQLSELTVANLGEPKFYAVNTIRSNNELWPGSLAQDGKPETAYSSHLLPGSNNDAGIYLAAWLYSTQTISEVYMQARTTNGRPQGFPRSYDVYLTSPNGSQWNFIGTFNQQPDLNGNVRLGLGKSFITTGVMIVPRTLGVDDFGGHYFQLAEIGLMGRK